MRTTPTHERNFGNDIENFIAREYRRCWSIGKGGKMKKIGNKEKGQIFQLIKIFLMLEGTILIFLGIFYYSCGQELYIRDSRGNEAGFQATDSAGEMTEGMEVAQTYTSQMDMIDQIGVMISDYGQAFAGELYVKCEDITDGYLIAEKRFSGEELGTNQYVCLDVGGVRVRRGNRIKITCISNGVSGRALTVLYSREPEPENRELLAGAQLTIDGTPVDGMMCLMLQGRDDVWTGPNYWKLVCAAVLLSAVWYAAELDRRRRGKWSFLFGMRDILQKYGFLIRQLVQRDFKVRYKRSVLGVLWSFLNPLLMMIVQYMVFSRLFLSDIENYPVYLLSGMVVFNFFSEGVGQALSSIVGNAALITKVYIPKYIYPVTRVLLSGINLVMSFIPLFLAVLITGERITKAYLMLPYILCCVMVFTIGLGMALAAGMTFFRDVQFLWGVASMLWMYLTPLFYPVSIIPDSFRPVIMANPMYSFVGAVRSIVMGGAAPQPRVFFMCTMSALVMLAAGSMIFKKTQDRFVFYI